jgi:hypothetical protein
MHWCFNVARQITEDETQGHLSESGLIGSAVCQSRYKNENH